MIFADIPGGVAVFLDANPFIYHFGAHPTFGPPCEALMKRIENQEVQGFTSAHVLSDVAHRLMHVEARDSLGWTGSGIVQRLKRHPTEVQQFVRYRQALDEIVRLGVQILPVTGGLVSLAADVSQQTGLLSSDALIIAVMRDHGLMHLASHDADFDRVPGVVRYAPV